MMRDNANLGQDNWQFTNCLKLLLESEAKCESVDMNMFYFLLVLKNSQVNKTNFQGEGFALCLVLNVKVFGTRNLTIGLNLSNNCNYYTSDSL